MSSLAQPRQQPVPFPTDGPIYFAGDTISHIVGWQEGAALSARRAVDMISDKVKAVALASGTHARPS